MARRFGLHAVMHALGRPGLVKEIWLQSGREDERIKQVVQLAKQQEVKLHSSDKHRLSQLAGSERHQGVVAECQAQAAMQIGDLENQLISQTHPALLLALDRVQDPHNLGAIIRSANASAVDAVIIPKNQSAQVTATVHKVAAGGADFTPVITVGSLNKTCQNLKSYNIQCVGLAGTADMDIYQVDFTQPTLIVMGTEGKGMRDSMREQCDCVARIPMLGQVESLNVSVATGITLFEALRQRKRS